MASRTKNPDKQNVRKLVRKYELQKEKQQFSSYISEAAGKTIKLAGKDYTIAKDGSYRRVEKKQKVKKGPKG